ncbi:MAG: DUF2141 domain-containing protein [Cyclobacteriaceae bacterium]|nr:DUF2141 domain-containing protein [Cyclobacteriaceae bacterium SS2]
MVKVVIISFFFFMSSLQSNHDFRIIIQGVDKIQGAMMIAIYQPDHTFLGDEAYLFKKIPVSQSDSLMLDVELPGGKYAVSVYHDLNGDGELNTNFLGIPKEPYGFSIARGTFGPPSFEDASFLVPGRRQITIEIE